MTTTIRHRSVPTAAWALLLLVGGCHLKCAKASNPNPPACPKGLVCAGGFCALPTVTSTDAGSVDDAGTPVDAGTPDSGPVDAGTGDGGVVDAGPVDAGPVDAGTRDAGEKDAGEEVDSGLAASIGVACFPSTQLAAGCSTASCTEDSDCCDGGSCSIGALPQCAQCKTSNAQVGSCANCAVNDNCCSQGEFCQTLGQDGVCQCATGVVHLCLPNCNTLDPECADEGETCSPGLGSCAPAACLGGAWTCPAWESCSTTTVGGAGVDVHGCSPNACGGTTVCNEGGECDRDAGLCVAIPIGQCQ